MDADAIELQRHWIWIADYVDQPTGPVASSGQLVHFDRELQLEARPGHRFHPLFRRYTVQAIRQ